MKRRIPKKYLNKWVLFDKRNKVLFSSEKVTDVIEKGWEYPENEVIIEKLTPSGTCFY